MTDATIDVELAHWSNLLGEPFSTFDDRIGRQSQITVAGYANAPIEQVVTLITAGVADLKGCKDHVGYLDQELLISCRDSFLSQELLDFFVGTAAVFVNEGLPLVGGNVLRFPRDVIPQSQMRFAYVCQPTHFETELWSVRVPPAREIKLRWLIPIHEREAALVESMGPDDFEECLEAQDPDLFDLARPPLVGVRRK